MEQTEEPNDVQTQKVDLGLQYIGTTLCQSKWTAIISLLIKISQDTPYHILTTCALSPEFQ